MHTEDRSPLPHPVLWLLCAIAATAMLTGCGGSTYPVRGKVVFKDNQAAAMELADYVITLESVDGKVSASGVVKPDGTFEVSTYEPGDGAVPGRHRVALNPPMSHELIEGPEATEPAPLIPDKYNTFDTSGLEITVDSSGQEVVVPVQRAEP